MVFLALRKMLDGKIHFIRMIPFLVFVLKSLIMKQNMMCFFERREKYSSGKKSKKILEFLGNSFP